MIKINRYLSRLYLVKLGFITALLLCLNSETYQVIDGVTAATGVIIVAAPTIKISATPSIVNNTIQAIAGQKITITINASDPNNYNAYVYSGLLQNGSFYAPGFGNPVLPAGAQLVNSGSINTTVFTWTPQPSSSPLFPVILQFMAYNTYANQNYSIAPAITIKVSDNDPPTFDASMSSQQTLVAEMPAKIPVVVNPDSDNDTVVIGANSLPAGATLGVAAKNSQGQWLAYLSWTPSLKQLGNTSITFTASDNNEAAQASFPMTFNVIDLTSPQFSGTMASLQKAVVNTPLTYTISMIPDLHTRDVVLTASGLPKGAVLSKPKLINGQLLATLTWSPTPNQLGTSPVVTFSVHDNLPGSVPVSFPVTFSVVSK